MREEVRKEFQDFTLVVSYSDTNSIDVHRYTIRCYHTTRWVTVFQDSNVIDKTSLVHIDDAASMVRVFYKQVFGIDILIEQVEDEEVIPVTYGMIKATCGWSKFCDVTGYNHYAIKEFGHPDDRTTYEIKRSEYDKLF